MKEQNSPSRKIQFPDEVIEIQDMWNYSLPESEHLSHASHLLTVYSFLLKIGYANLLEAVAATLRKTEIVGLDNRFKYFCATCHAINGTRKPKKQPPDNSTKLEPVEEALTKVGGQIEGAMWCPVCRAKSNHYLSQITSCGNEAYRYVEYNLICDQGHVVRRKIQGSSDASDASVIFERRDDLPMGKPNG